jgi:predicted DNA-binding protein
MNDKTEVQVQTAIRLPRSLLTRLDKMAERMSRPGMPVTRAEVLRLAAHKGVDLLEAELKAELKRR